MIFKRQGSTVSMLMLVACGISLLASPAARADDSPPTQKPATSDQTRSTLPFKRPAGTESGVLSELRDTRLSLTQVKQQAVNLFLEATRTVVTPEEPALEHSPHELTASMIQPAKSYEQPRKEWLVFYVNTLEPIIHLLTEDMKDAESNGLGLPESISQDKLNPLWKQWKADVVDINKSMDRLQDLITPDSGTNMDLARTALAIYDSASNMEKVRFEAAQICRQELLRSGNSKASNGAKTP